MSDSGSPRPGKVLVMDDDDLVRATARLMLRRLGFDVVLAADCEQAVALYGELLATDYPVDVAILDLMMVGGQGAVQAAAQILALDPNALLVVASGSPDHQIMTDHESHGFTACLAKPYLVTEVGLLLGTLLK